MSNPGTIAHFGFPVETLALFGAIFAVFLTVDLLQHKSGQEVTFRNAAGWSALWIGLSLGFYGWLRVHHGAEFAHLFLTGYVLEKTLSIDNLIVFIAVFRYFGLESGAQHRVLYYGILGALFFRAVFVSVGAGLLLLIGPFAEFLFGAFVAWAAIKMLRGGGGDQEPDYDQMPLVRLVRRFYPVFPRLHGLQFFVSASEAQALQRQDSTLVVEKGVTRWVTPAFVCLLVIEGSDVAFSVDSVPAVIAITKEPVLIYTAMIFAVLGLRSLYFLVAAMTRYLVHLEKAVVAVLLFIAFKMFYVAIPHIFYLAYKWKYPKDIPPFGPSFAFEITPSYSMAIVLITLSLGVLASFLWPATEESEGSPAD